MACFAVVVIALTLCNAAPARSEASGSAITPVQKVIELLKDMVEKGTKEKQDEQVQFASYKTFCDNTVANKQKAIDDADEMVGVLKADVAKYTEEAAELSKQISAHDSDIATWEGDLDAATKVRAIENTEFLKSHEGYKTSIKAVDEGIAKIAAQQGDTKLLQLEHIPERSRKIVVSFLRQNQKIGEGAPEANAYESQTTGLTDMLEGLGSKFEDEKGALETKEAEAKHSFEMLAQDLRSQIDSAKGARTEKAEAKAKALQAAAAASGELKDTAGTKAADEKYVTDLTTTCEQKSEAFANRQQLRSEELEAVKQAIEILSSGKVAGASERTLPQLAQVPPRATALGQLRAEHHAVSQIRVADYLKRQAVKLNSRVLSAMSVRVTADPFKKVKKMIKDLIVKLVEEAGEEAEQKGWCDKEMSTNKHTRKEKTEAVEMLHATIDELEASITQLTEQIGELSAAITDLDGAVAKATSIRTEERAKNKQTIHEAKEAQVAVSKALDVLNNFYAKAAGATSLSQFGAEPEVFSDEPYKGMGGESGGVVGMIEVIQSDFARLEAETTAAEAEATKEYDSLMSDSKIDKTEKGMDYDHATSMKQDQEQALQQAKAELEGTEKELTAAMAFYEKLKPTCVNSPVSYEDKVKRREEEIDSLKTALRVLNNEEVLL